jgi:predicted methyltransferase
MKLMAALIVLGLSANAALAADAQDYIATAIADPSRPKEDVAKDGLRDPAETLAFSGIRPGMKVVEFAPEGGYYSRLLIDVVGPKGSVRMLENAGWYSDVGADLKVFNQVNRPNLFLEVQLWGQFRTLERVDMVWTTQNYHDLHVAKFGQVDIAAFNRKVFNALKPGGIYLIIDHDGLSQMSADNLAELHRIPKSQVVAEVTAAGFKLVDEGKFLQRPTDDLSKFIADPAVRYHTSQFALKFVRP